MVVLRMVFTGNSLAVQGPGTFTAEGAKPHTHPYKKKRMVFISFYSYLYQN